MISKTQQYAIRAVLHLAQHDANTTLRAAEIARALELPANYLSKILNVLARADLLDSERGPRGGFRLARRPGEILLAEVIEPFDPLMEWRRCLLGRERCSDDDPCPLHESWKRASDPLIEFFQQTAVADLIGETD